MRKIAVSITKGGVGKTTTAINLAAGLADAGMRVLLIDADSQGHASFMFGVDPKLGLAELISKSVDIYDVIIKARPGLHLIAGRETLSVFNQWAANIDKQGEQLLSEVLNPLEGQYDFVILDTPPAWDAMAVNVHFYAREIIVPVSLDILTLKGLSDFEHCLNAMSAFKTARMDYILPTFLDGRVRKSREVYEILKNHYGARVCLPIRYNVRLSEAAGHGQTIFEYDSSSQGAYDYSILTERIIKDVKA